jgi:hypothetical protein
VYGVSKNDDDDEINVTHFSKAIRKPILLCLFFVLIKVISVSIQWLHRVPSLFPPLGTLMVLNKSPRLLRKMKII